jgi:hypothetical protein
VYEHSFIITRVYLQTSRVLALFSRVLALFSRVLALFSRVLALFSRVLIQIKPYGIRVCIFLKYSQVFSRSSRKKKNGKESQHAWTKTKPLYVKLTDQNQNRTGSLFTLLDGKENDPLLHYQKECTIRSSDQTVLSKKQVPASQTLRFLPKI